MATPLSFKSYLSYVDDEKSSKTKKKLNKKSPKGRYYGGASADGVNGLLGTPTGDAAGGMGESEIPTVWKKSPMNIVPEDEEDEIEDNLDTDEDIELDDASDEVEISDEEPVDELDGESEDDMEEDEDPDRQGVIRVVKSAHMVYKRKDEEGSYEELWIYKLGKKVKDDLEVRRDIIAGTDIPKGSTKSEDGSQKIELWSSGNIQMLLITGLPN